ncbi:hypothetical protein L6164_028400 [Bauhinia variegata]|uniref:Uncharacterized protein n=1 Tax=Bauhinia variegata TaxID=167791 RepID=A0ACB9L6L0_BAUVA|nr:hypothetical protein L6164_028400 [Bauhinia variegata]
MFMFKGFHYLEGFTLFRGFIIDRMHHYLGKLINLRSNAGASKEELEKLHKERESSFEKWKRKPPLQVETAEAHVVSLQKQAADLLLEYDRLLEDNQNLQA